MYYNENACFNAFFEVYIFFDVIYDLKGNLKPVIILTNYAEGLKVLFCTYYRRNFIYF